MKRKAIEHLKESSPDAKLAAVIVNHRQVTVEEYKEVDKLESTLGSAISKNRKDSQENQLRAIDNNFLKYS